MAASAPCQVHITITELVQYGNINLIGQLKAQKLLQQRAQLQVIRKRKITVNVKFTI